jgi:hypothetical protein
MNAFHRGVARLLVICTVALGMPLPATAGMIGTDQIAAPTGIERDKVRGFLDRQEVRERMQALGVDPAAARERVDALTDEEVGRLASRIDELPAGGNIVGVLFTVFIILLITDILGLTKVFPFTRPIR